MKKNKVSVKTLCLRAGCVALALVLMVAARAPLWEVTKKVALFSAGIQLPSSSPATSSPSSGGVSSVPVSIGGEPPFYSEWEWASEPEPFEGADDDGYNIVRETLTLKSGDLEYNGVTLSNHTKNHTLNLATLLSRLPVFDLVRNGRPQILIFHTHTSESYLEAPADSYQPGQVFNTKDEARNMIAIGEVIARALTDQGINVIHDTGVYDTNFNSSYENAGRQIEQILKKYSSIEMVLDIHRDSVTLANRDKVKPTAEINGRDAAQVMIVAGCNEEGALPFPNWEYNLRTAVRLQQKMNALYPGLARPIYFIPRRYNMHYTKNSLLIEVGTEVNTLSEALYAAQLFSDALLAMLDEI